jgi:hypothetical protein
VSVGHFNEGYLVLELTGVTSTVSIIKESSLIIYPNPANDYIIIENRDVNIKTIELIDITGKTVKTVVGLQDRKINFDISEITKGLYFLKVKTHNNKTTVKKIVVNS